MKMAVSGVLLKTHRHLETSSIGQSCLSLRHLFAVLCAVTLYLSADVTLAMRVTTSGPQTLVLVQGEQATLSCIYTADPTDTGELDIEWSLVNPDTTQKDQLILSYSGGSKHFHDNSVMKEGVDFAANDPSLGDASLLIDSLLAVHAGTYQCKVKKSPGVDMLKVSLVVKERPSVPVCRLQGSPIIGENAVLRCAADRGSAPLQYVWTRESGPLPPTATSNLQTGELLISNHSVDFAGIYVCEVTNDVGKEQCRLNLQAVNPPSRAGVIAGIICGCLLLIIIIFIVVWIFVFRRKQNRYEKDGSNEIREDVPAPVSRPSSRASSFQSRGAYSQVHQHRPPSPNSSNTGYSYDRGFGHVV